MRRLRDVLPEERRNFTRIRGGGRRTEEKPVPCFAPEGFAVIPDSEHHCFLIQVPLSLSDVLRLAKIAPVIFVGAEGQYLLAL